MQKLRPDMDIGQNIQKQRRRCNMTQENVIAKLELLEIYLSRSTYAKIEANSYNIKISELVALKKIFKMSSFDPFFDGLV